MRIEKATEISTTNGMPRDPVAARISPFSSDMKPTIWVTALRRVIIISKPSRITARANAKSSRVSTLPSLGCSSRMESATRARPASIVGPPAITVSTSR